MKILALETSAGPVSAAVAEDGALLCRSWQNTGLTHSVTLMPMVDGMLKNVGLSLSEIDLVAVAAGPGSFTGLRIGVSAAKGLAWTLERPCCGVSTLEAMAYNALSFEGTVVCAMDARRSQIYNAVFDCRGGLLTRRCDDRAVSLEQLGDELAQDVQPRLVLGDGAKLCADYLAGRGIDCRMAPAAVRFQDAAGVALCAEKMALRGQICSAQTLRPCYLRLSQAERERLARGLSLTPGTQDGHA